MREIVERVAAHVQRLGSVGAGPERLRGSIEQHRGIVAAVRAGDAPRAQEHLRAHLASVLQDQLRSLPPTEETP